MVDILSYFRMKIWKPKLSFPNQIWSLNQEPKSLPCLTMCYLIPRENKKIIIKSPANKMKEKETENIDVYLQIALKNK